MSIRGIIFIGLLRKELQLLLHVRYQIAVLIVGPELLKYLSFGHKLMQWNRNMNILFQGTGFVLVQFILKFRFSYKEGDSDMFSTHLCSSLVD